MEKHRLLLAERYFVNLYKKIYDIAIEVEDIEKLDTSSVRSVGMSAVTIYPPSSWFSPSDYEEIESLKLYSVITPETVEEIKKYARSLELYLGVTSGDNPNVTVKLTKDRYGQVTLYIDLDAPLSKQTLMTGRFYRIPGWPVFLGLTGQPIPLSCAALRDQLLKNPEVEWKVINGEIGRECFDFVEHVKDVSSKYVNIQPTNLEELAKKIYALLPVREVYLKQVAQGGNSVPAPLYLSGSSPADCYFAPKLSPEVEERAREVWAKIWGELESYVQRENVAFALLIGAKPPASEEERVTLLELELKAALIPRSLELTAALTQQEGSTLTPTYLISFEDPDVGRVSLKFSGKYVQPWIHASANCREAVTDYLRKGLKVSPEVLVNFCRGVYFHRKGSAEDEIYEALQSIAGKWFFRGSLGHTLSKLLKSVRFSNEIPTAAVSDKGELLINPDFAQTLTLEQLEVVFLHEALHLLLRHFERMGHRYPEVWNLVTDLAINSILKEVFGLEGKDWIEPTKLQLPPLKSAEEYFEMFVSAGEEAKSLPDLLSKLGLPSFWADEIKSRQPGEGAAQEGGAGEGEQPSGQGETGESAASALDELAKAIRDWGGALDTHPTRPITENPLQGEAKQVANDLEQSSGKSYAEKVKKIFSKNFAPGKGRGEKTSYQPAQKPTPRPEWSTVLMSHLVPEMKRNFLRPNPTYADQGLIAPSLDIWQRLKVIIAVDTSGSTQDYISNFLHQAKALLESYLYYQAVILAGDTKVSYVTEIDETTGFPEKIRAVGAGGTDLKPFFEYAEEQGLFDEGYKVMVVFTDLYVNDATIPQEPPREDVFVLWVVPESIEDHYMPSFGEVAYFYPELDEDEDNEETDIDSDYDYDNEDYYEEKDYYEENEDY